MFFWIKEIQINDWKCRVSTTHYTVNNYVYTHHFIIIITTQHQYTRYPLQDDDHDRRILRILIVVIMIFVCRSHTCLNC